MLIMKIAAVGLIGVACAVFGVGLFWIVVDEIFDFRKKKLNPRVEWAVAIVALLGSTATMSAAAILLAGLF